MTSSSKMDEAATGRADLTRWRAAASANPFEQDPFLQRLLRRVLPDSWEQTSERLHQLGEDTGPEFDDKVRECNRDENLPRVRRHDELGHPIEEVAFHPAHHEVGAVFWRSGILAELERPGSERVAAALGYLLSQHGEAGHACPVACTAGAIKLLQRVGTPEQRERWLPPLLDRDYAGRLHAAQFVTEVQGGSDVGLNACLATPDPARAGSYRLSGEKWFCSVADAGLFVVSARVDGGGEGTKGLGLFLVPRHVNGRPNGFRLRRLKYKLGTRSMPTGEIEFDGALAEPIGALEHGFRNLVGVVLDTSRVHNAVAACALMRRSFTIAHGYAHHRRAFGGPIADFPSAQETLARMKVRTMANLASTYWILDVSDRLATGGDDPGLEGARRLAVMINKYRTAIACTASVRDGIEILGGNGTIEDFSVLPRLYRDAIVLESWEGSHNTLCAQILRDMATRGLHEAWLGAQETEIGALAHPDAADAKRVAIELLDDARARITSLLGSEPERAAAHVRHVVDRMGILSDWVSLGRQLQWDREQGMDSDVSDALDSYRKSYIERVDPQADPELIALHRRLARGL